jgi:hypothetical protein
MRVEYGDVPRENGLAQKNMGRRGGADEEKVEVVVKERRSS